MVNVIDICISDVTFEYGIDYDMEKYEIDKLVWKNIACTLISV